MVTVINVYAEAPLVQAVTSLAVAALGVSPPVLPLVVAVMNCLAVYERGMIEIVNIILCMNVLMHE
jgi:hypothetical protein